jgi:hypothetical protein
LINNEWTKVTDLCRPAHSFQWPMADPIVSIYERGEELFRSWFGERFIIDNTGPIDYAHREMRGIMRRGEIAWTPRVTGTGGMSAPDVASLRAELSQALMEFEKGLSQYGNIRDEDIPAPIFR